MSKPTKIILNRQSDLVLNNATIVTPTGIVKSDIPELVSDLGGLRTDVNLVTDKVDLILEGATASLDQFREVVAFVNNIDTENQNSLISIYASMSSAYSGLSASLNQIITDLPDADDSTLEVDVNNLIRLKDTVAPGIGGVRTFEGDNKAGVQPDTLDSYDALSFVTKGILDDAIRANIKDWSETTFRFAEDDVLQLFGFPQTLSFMQFVSNFYGSYDGYDGNYASYLQDQFGQGNFGQHSVRKDQIIDAIMDLGEISLNSEIINHAINGNTEAFNKIYQIEKYYEIVEIAIERFNEAVMKAHMLEEARANIKDWASTSFRFAEDDVLQLFGFPQTLEFMQFVSNFYGSYDGYDGNYASYLQNQFSQGNFGQHSVRKNAVIDAIMDLGEISLNSEIINHAINGNAEAFNKIFQLEKYYETVEIAIERFNEAVMKAHMLEEVRSNIKDWASTSFRFAEDDVLDLFGFPETLELMQFVSNFYGSYDGYDGSYASYLQNQFSQGNFGQHSVRKNAVIDAIMDLGSISLNSEIINHAINGNAEAFNKIFQLEKYYETVEIAIERFNEAVMKAHMLEEVRANIKDWASTSFRFAEDDVLDLFGFPETLEFMQFVSNFYGSYDGYDGNYASYLQNQFGQGNFGQHSVRKNAVIDAIMDLGSISLNSEIINHAINGNAEAFNKIFQLEKYYETVEIAIERFNEAVMKAHMLEEVRSNIKDWASTSFRFAEDDVLDLFGFPETLEFMQFVSNFYGSYDGYDGSYASYLQNQFSQGNFGQHSVRKNAVIDAIMNLGSISLNSEIINHAINGNAEAFNKIFQLEKYYETVEIAIERFNEAVMKAHVLEEVRANIKDWSEATLRFTEDSILGSFGFPQTITFIEFVKQFYNDGFGSYIESQYNSGAFGEKNQRKQSLVNAILELDETSLPSEVINHAANNNVEAFNKIFQLEKYYEMVEIAIERFNEAVISVQLQLQIDNLSTEIDTNINTNIDALESDLQTEINNRISGDSYLQYEIDLLPLTDGDTIEVDLVGNFVRLKEVVSAPDSGVRTFEGDIKVSAQPDTKGSYNDYSLITKGVMDSRLSDEVSTLNSTIDERDQRAIDAEADLQSQIDTERVRIDAILEGSDVELNQFREVVDFVNGIVAENPDSIYNQISQVNIELDAETAERLRLTNLLGDGLEQEVIDREDGDAFIQHQIDILPLTDGDTIEVDPFNNYVRLKDHVSVNPDLGYRVFEGDLKISSENSDLPSFNDLSLVTKKYSDTSRNALNNLIVQEVDRAMSSESAIVEALDSVENRVDDVEAIIAGLPNADDLSIEVTSSNTISLKDSISAGSEGVRTFGGVLNADAEPSLDANFGPLTYVTKGFVESLSTNVGNDLAAEIARATAAEAALGSDLASETSRATEAEATLASDLASETSRATAAEATLTSDLAAEVSRATAAEAGLQSSIEAILAGSTTDLDNFKEVVDFVNSIDLANDNSLIAAVATFSAALSAEESRATAAEAALGSDLAAEVSRATAAEAALGSDLAAEVSRATAVEATLTSDLASEVSRATAAEGALSADLASETSRALAAEAALSATFSAAIAAERSRAQLVENEIYATFSSSIAAEVSRATAAEAQLSTELDNLQTYVDTTVDSAIATLTADLAAETTARIEAESALQNNINAEANERAAEDVTLQSNINTEASRAQAAESAIAADLATETAARIAADSALTSDLASETSRATAAEAGLQSSIDAILAGSITDLDNFKEVVDFVNSIDMANDNNLIAAVATFSVALSAEESRAMAAEAALSATFSAAIASEISRATAAEAALTSALSAEEAARIAGDSTLQASLDNERTDRIAAVQSLQSSLTSESTRAIAAEAALSATFSIAIAAEISRATAAEAALSATFSAAIAAEISRATAAEATLTSDLASEVSRAKAAEAAIVADFNNIYSKKVSVIGTPNGTLTSFSLAKPVRIGSEMVYLNGLLMEEGEDYTTTISSGKVSGIEFISAPVTDMKVLAYGVCGI